MNVAVMEHVPTLAAGAAVALTAITGLLALLLGRQKSNADTAETTARTEHVELSTALDLVQGVRTELVELRTELAQHRTELHELRPFRHEVSSLRTTVAALGDHVARLEGLLIDAGIVPPERPSVFPPIVPTMLGG